MNISSRTFFSAALPLLMVTIFVGCATPDPAALERKRVLKEKRSQVMAISIQEEVDIVSVPVVRTPGKAWGRAVGGLIGVAIASLESTTNEGYYVKFLKDNNIDLKAIVRDSIKRTLAEQRPDLQLVDDPAAPSLKINIQQYGVVSNSKMSVSDVRPLLKVRLKLTADGLVLWAGGSVSRKEEGESNNVMSYDEFMKNPDKLKQSYIAIADQVAQALLVGINKTIPKKM